MLDKFDTQNDAFRTLVNTRGGYDPQQLLAAQNLGARCRMDFDTMFGAFCVDAMLTPASMGEAPQGLASTGDARMNSMWTFLYAPCVAIPGALGDAGLPVGLRTVGPRYGDVHLLGIAYAIAPVIGALGRV